MFIVFTLQKAKFRKRMLYLNKKNLFFYLFTFLLCLANIKQLSGTIWLTRSQAEALAILIQPELKRPMDLDDFMQHQAAVRAHATESMSRLYQDEYAHFLSDEFHFLTASQIVAAALSDQSRLSDPTISSDLAKEIILYINSLNTSPNKKEITEQLIQEIERRSGSMHRISKDDTIMITAIMEDLLICQLQPHRRSLLSQCPRTPLKLLAQKTRFVLGTMENAIRNTLIAGWGCFHHDLTTVQYFQEISLECNRLAALIERQISPFTDPDASDLFFQTLIATITAFLDECSTFLSNLQHDLRLNLSMSTLNYPQNKFFSLWCQCPCATFSERIFLIASMATEVRLNAVDPTHPLIYTSFGSGHFFQDYLALKVLHKLGYSQVVVHLIDHVYEPTNPNHERAMADICYLAEKLRKETCAPVKVQSYNETGIALTAEAPHPLEMCEYYQIYLHPSYSSDELRSHYPCKASLAVCMMVDAYIPEDFEHLFEGSKTILPTIGWMLEKNTITNNTTKAVYHLPK